MNKSDFQNQIIAWYEKNGRKNLPWQVSDPYCVWVSEIMLQQTQVSSVIGYFNKFISRFPTLSALANAEIDDVVSHWSGLGYYNRARNLHKTAKICTIEYADKLPIKLDELIALPGIGRTTAGAILSLSFDLSYPILDGNVKRVLSRVFKICADTPSHFMTKLWKRAETLMPQKNARKHNQALMDLGSMICKRSKPNCENCPFVSECKAFKNNQVNLYPQKNKKAKQVPQTLHAILVKNNQNIFLQQRDSKSIWPGLWFLPIFSSQEDLASTISIEHGKILSVFSVEHILTHRKLTIKVTVVQMSSTSTMLGKWQDLGKISSLPHPTALNKVIEY